MRLSVFSVALSTGFSRELVICSLPKQLAERLGRECFLAVLSQLGLAGMGLPLSLRFLSSLGGPSGTSEDTEDSRRWQNLSPLARSWEVSKRAPLFLPGFICSTKTEAGVPPLRSITKDSFA